MISEITNFRNFRQKLSHYLDKVKTDGAVAIKSKDREAVLISMEKYRELTMDETEYLLSTEANKEHLLRSIQDLRDGKGKAIKTEDLWK